jgi:hypothetical protein
VSYILTFEVRAGSCTSSAMAPPARRALATIRWGILGVSSRISLYAVDPEAWLGWPVPWLEKRVSSFPTPSTMSCIVATGEKISFAMRPIGVAFCKLWVRPVLGPTPQRRDRGAASCTHDRPECMDNRSTATGPYQPGEPLRAQASKWRPEAKLEAYVER